MKNPHVIVGNDRQCLCGRYDDFEAALLGVSTGREILCSEVLSAMERMKLAAQNGANIQPRDALLIATAIEPLIQECGIVAVGEG